MMKKEKLTDEQKQHNRKLSGLKRSLLSQCSERGLRVIELQYEYLKDNENAKTREGLSRNDVIECFDHAIHKYKNKLSK